VLSLTVSYGKQRPENDSERPKITILIRFTAVGEGICSVIEHSASEPGRYARFTRFQAQ
jgi:hypothetical protein